MIGPLKVAVIGAGAIGSWSALELARRGATVTLIDAWGPGNLRSSSSGERRIIRATYGPDGFYVPLVDRSYELWQRLEYSVGLKLYEETGLLWLFGGTDEYAERSLEHLEPYGLSLEALTRNEARARFPALVLDDVDSIYFEPRAGLIAARRATRAVRDLFVREGGTYRCARAVPPEETPSSLDSLELSETRALRADAFVFACGPWLGELLPETLGKLIRPSRQEEYYLAPPPGPGYHSSELPPWLNFEDGMSYGVPASSGRGVKVADDRRGEPFDPTDSDRTPSFDGLRRLRRLLSRRLPDLADAPLLEARVCQYENSPDGHLILDRHSRLENVWIAGGGSGHAFKLAPAIGEMVARMILDGAGPIREFRLDRFENGLDSMNGSSSQYEV